MPSKLLEAGKAWQLGPSQLPSLSQCWVCVAAQRPAAQKVHSEEQCYTTPPYFRTKQTYVLHAAGPCKNDVGQIAGALDRLVVLQVIEVAVHRW